VRPLFLPLIGWVLELVGCADPNAPIKTSAGKLTQAQVDAIVQQCGGVPGTGNVRYGKLVIQPKDISITVCVLDALKATGQTALTGSVGNEFHTPHSDRTS
jgi:hypothetical protein